MGLFFRNKGDSVKLILVFIFLVGCKETHTELQYKVLRDSEGQCYQVHSVAGETVQLKRLPRTVRCDCVVAQ